MVNGIVCPTRAPETQVFVKHSKSKLEEKNVRTTYMAKPGEVERKWYVVDATDVPLGRLSTVVASVLRGKNKPTFTPHLDTGDFVIVIIIVIVDFIIVVIQQLLHLYYAAKINQHSHHM